MDNYYTDTEVTRRLEDQLIMETLRQIGEMKYILTPVEGNDLGVSK